MNFLTWSDLHCECWLICARIPSLEVIGGLVGFEGWVKILLEHASPVRQSEGDVVEAVVRQVTAASADFVLVGVECPLGKHREALAGLTVGELTQGGDQAWSSCVVLEELYATITSARVVHKLVLSVEIKMRNTTAFHERTASNWALALLTNVPDCPFALVEFVKAARNDS